MGLNILTASQVVNHGAGTLSNSTIGTEAALFIPSTFTNGNRISLKGPGSGSGLKTFFINTTGVGGLSLVIQSSATSLSKVNDTAILQLNRPNFGAATYSFGVSGALFHGMDDRPVSAIALVGDINGTGTPVDISSQTLYVGANGVAGTQPLQGNMLWYGQWTRILTVHELEICRQWALWLAGVTSTYPTAEAIPWRECVLFCLYGATDVAQVDYSPFRNHGLAGGARCTPPMPITDPYPWQPPLPTQLFPSL